MRLLLLLGLFVGACAPSPLFVSHRPLSTPGEIPRDERGEPMWSRIGPPRPSAAPMPQPVPSYPPQPR